MKKKFKNIFRFWKEVILRSFRSAFSTLSFGSRVFNIALTILTILFIAIGITFGINQIDFLNQLIGGLTTQLTLLLVLIFILLLRIIFGLIYYPAVLYEELGGFDELKLECVFDCSPPRYSEAWSALAIRNNSDQPIKGCFVILEKVENIGERKNILKRAEKLSWSSAHAPIDGDKIIPALEAMAVDIVKTDHQNNRIIFTTQRNDDLYRDKAPVGQYTVYLRVEGIYGKKRFNRPLKGTIHYQGQVRLSCHGPE